MAAEPACKSHDLPARLLKRARAIDSLGGEFEFFLHGHLRSDAAARFGLAEATREEALELLFWLAPGDDDAIQILVHSRFDEQRGFDKGGGAPRTLPLVELAKDGFADAGMDDGVEAIQFCAIVENDSAQFGAVDAAIAAENALAEFLDDICESRLTGLDEFMGEGVGIEDGEAEFAQHGGNGAFAAGDSTGEAESEHVPG
jgi:hypothetical protein